MIVKINSTVNIYRLNGEIYINDSNEVFSLREINNKDYIIKLIKELEKGIDVEKLNEIIDKDKSGETKEFVEFLKVNRFVSKIENSNVEPSEVNFRSVIDKELMVIEREKIKNFSIGIIDVNQNSFNKRIYEKLLNNEFNVEIIEYNEKKELNIVIKQNLEDEKVLKDVNEYNCKKGQACLYIDVSMHRYFVFGPLVIPNKTACYDCYMKRKLINDDINTRHAILDKENIIKTNNSFVAFQEEMFIAFIQDEILNYILNINPKTINNILYFDLATFDSWQENLLRYPKCKICNL